ncbi:E3 ubiquitin-protein ligase SIRP1-like [Vigna umbellata]|uniref:E3 ubiquitin-protein ligase SIRP1-like n=1 Tax=Vigna umbellata TaxID=87088 RepID=UPI001F5ED227|nr:E3 ubiquitin-protein ligase SIRP1-like [Vigna umbellata]
MPLNRGQRQTTRWYHQLCFVPTSSDSSDDSDVESVIITPSTTITTSRTWQELSPPLPLPPSPPPPPPNPEPQMDWRFLPPPPPPDFARPLLLQQHQLDLSGVWAILNEEVLQDRLQSPNISHVFEGDNSGCSTIAMNGLSRVRVSETDKLFLCPICMDEFKVCDQAYRLPCTHTYCSECILRWLNSSKTCPVCRLQLNNNNNLNSHVEFLSTSLSSTPSPYFRSPLRPEYLVESSLYPTAGVENSASGNSDEADYDSACDELGDSQEDGASHTANDL